MKRIIPILLVTLLCYSVVQAQYYDTCYVKNIQNKVLVSYFQEYRGIDIKLTPDKSIDSLGKESLQLSSSSPLYSGFLIQYKGISIYLAGNTAQTPQSKNQFGTQNSNIWKISMLYKAIFANFNSIRYDGFYDKNFKNHHYFKQDSLPYNRYQSMRTIWRNVDVKYYPSYKKFAQGIPSSYGLRQTKSKVSMGYKVCYNYLKTRNNKALFSDSLSQLHNTFTTSSSTYHGINVSAAPSLYLVAFKKLFFYADAWAGLDIGSNKIQGKSFKESKTTLAFVVPEVRTVLGFQTNQWIVAAYYSYLNQSFNNQWIKTTINYNTFGALVGYRFYSPARLAF